MADNVAITAGSGTTIAADDVSGVLVQRVKVTWGPDGTANDVDDDTGKRLPVEVAEPLPAGTNAIGKLAANSGVDIGDVDVTSVVPGTAATNLGKAEDAGHTSGDVGVMALTVRQDTAAALGGTDADYQPLITDSTGRLHVAAGATENLIGKVGAPDLQVQITPTMDTSAYGSGDVWISETEIANAARTSGGVTILQSLTILDKDDQTAAAVDLYFFDRTVTFGTKNSAPSISDADAAYYQGHVSIAAADWKDLGGCKVVCKAGIGLAMKPNATSLFVAATVTGTPTNTASGIVINCTFLRS